MRMEGWTVSGVDVMVSEGVRETMWDKGTGSTCA